MMDDIDPYLSFNCLFVQRVKEEAEIHADFGNYSTDF